MIELPKYYTVLFNAVEEASAALDRMDFGVAKTLLLRGQLQAEGEYLAIEEQMRKEKTCKEEEERGTEEK